MVCRGRVRLKLLCVAEESGEYVKLTEEIPFDGGVDIGEGAADARCRVRGILSQMSVNVNDRVADCNIGILLETVEYANREVVYTTDIYSTKNECECQVANVSLRSALACTDTNITLSERIESSRAGLPEDAEIIDTLGRVWFDKCELVGGKYVFGGNVEFVLIYRKDGEIYSGTVTIPQKYEMQALSPIAPASFDCTGAPTNIRARLDGKELRLDAELLISADCVGESTAKTVQSVRFGERIDKGESELIVCYPSDDDSLWSVAKRYRVAPDRVLGDPVGDKYVIIE
jgi:hypothetical protein